MKTSGSDLIIGDGGRQTGHKNGKKFRKEKYNGVTGNFKEKVSSVV